MKPTRPNRLDRILYFIESSPISDRWLLKLIIIALLGSLLSIGLRVNDSFTAEAPTSGGTIVEGVVGIPRFVNPVLSVTRVDQDMSALIYGGLMKIDPEGKLEPYIAESIELQEDGQTYHIKLKDNVHFHDGSLLTARDVAYTIALIQNPNLKSPLQGNWDGVLVEELGEYELNVVIEEPYTPFLENFTVGILPRAIWDELPIEQLPFSQHNTEPIGAGPFKISNLKRDNSGLIESYELTAFNEAIERPKIDSFVMHFYQNEEKLTEAFETGEIMNTTGLPSHIVKEAKSDGAQVIEQPLPRVFAIFLNQNRSTVLRDKAVRRALSAAIDRGGLIDDVLDGFGVPTTSPVPPGFIAIESSSTTIASTSTDPTPEEILETAGWHKTTEGSWKKTIDEEEVVLSVTIATANTPTFERTANAVATAWQQLGVEVSVEQFEQADLLQGIIRPRNFQALLFGADLSRSIDLYPFWHSSQKDDPGLNVSQYTNIEVDDLLETIRTSRDEEEVHQSIAAVEDTISDDLPAIFLYVPNLVYLVDENITVGSLKGVSKPHERFSNIEDWHVETGSLWPIFNTEN